MIKTNQSGRSMVEMLGVLAIIGVLSVGGIAGYSKAMNKYKINKTTDQISMLVANIRTMFATQGDYKELDNGKAKNYGIVPNDMYTSTDSSGKITNAFGGDVVIKTSDLRDTSDEKAFVVAYEGLTQEACITIVTGDWGSAQGSGLIAIGATNKNDDTILDSVLITETEGNKGGTDKAGYGIPGGKTVPTPISVANATDWCSSEASENSVVWKYY